MVDSNLHFCCCCRRCYAGQMEQTKQSGRTAGRRQEPLLPGQMLRKSAQNALTWPWQGRGAQGPTAATATKAPQCHPHRHFFYILFVLQSNQGSLLAKPGQTSDKKTVLHGAVPPSPVSPLDLTEFIKVSYGGCWCRDPPPPSQTLTLVPPVS